MAHFFLTWWRRLLRLIFRPPMRSYGKWVAVPARHTGRRRKPDWVTLRLVRLKARMPSAGCRQIAQVFNRLYGARRGVTVGKSFVAETLSRHHCGSAEERRHLRRRQARLGRRNAVWAMDLTGKRDEAGRVHSVLGIIDHGTRLALMLRPVPVANAWTMLGYLCIAIRCWGRPEVVRTDNASIFTARLFRAGLTLIGIRHQRSAPGCPWQNGRIERLFGTLKAKLDMWSVTDEHALARSLALFAMWYNHVRPHQNLGGRTPCEAWQGIDPFAWPTRKAVWFSAWDGLLTGYFIRR